MRHRLRQITPIVLLTVWILIFFIPLHAQQPSRRSSRAKPQIPVANVRFVSGNRALGIPFQLAKGFILVQVRVNNTRVRWFIFDTGASASVIDAQVAKELRLRAQGKVKGTANENAIETELFPGVSFALSGVKVFNQTVASLPLDSLSSVTARPISGIIGYDFIENFVVEVDYASRTINLYSTVRYKQSPTAVVVPIKFINQKPFVEASITMKGRDPVAGIFEIDTGGDGVMFVYRPFVEAHQLLTSAKGFRPGNVGGASGGVSSTLQGRVKNVQVGRFVIDNPIVTFSQAAISEEARADGDGSLNGEFLRRFKLVLDYQRRRIILEPNEHLTEPVEDDMSGFELIAEGENLKTFTISEVLANSPAAEAGLKEEDEVRAIDGRPVSELGLERVREMLKQEGKEYLLSIKRDEQVQQVKIKLRRLI
jgi:Aspartyl protease/PDZ domain